MPQLSDKKIGPLPLAFRVDESAAGKPPLILLHGAARTIEDWMATIPHLQDRFQVIAVDLRGHGKSGASEWTWQTVTQDVQDLIADMHLSNYLIAGHSLGGMIAAFIAADKNTVGCLGAINFDGHGSGTPELYEGIETPAVEAKIDAIEALSGQVMEAQSQPINDAMLAQYEAGILTQIKDEQQAALFVAGLHRAMEQQDDGMWHMKPSIDIYQQMTVCLHRLDLLQVYRSTSLPLLIIKTTQNNGDEQLTAMIDGFADMQTAYNNGLIKALTSLTAEHSLVSFKTMDTGHSMLTEAPEATAAVIHAFADSLSVA